MFEHARFSIERNETDSESFVGDIFVLLLVVEDVFDVGVKFGGGKAADGGFIVVVAVAKAVGFGGFLEFIDNELEFSEFGGEGGVRW